MNSRVMLSTNIDTNDRLINGHMGTVTKIALENKNLRANPKVNTEYQRMRRLDNSYSKSSHIDAVNDFRNLEACLLNIRSLRKHSIDIKYDASVANCDISALTETQLLLYHSDDTIRETLHPYELHRKDYLLINIQV